jgi:hypothetical protein
MNYKTSKANFEEEIKTLHKIQFLSLMEINKQDKYIHLCYENSKLQLIVEFYIDISNNEYKFLKSPIKIKKCVNLDESAIDKYINTFIKNFVWERSVMLRDFFNK